MISKYDMEIQYAEFLLREDKNDEAIETLRRKSVPDDPIRCSLLAKAYYQRGDAKGDMHASHFFASRAVALGNDEPWVLGIMAISAFRKERYAEAAETMARYVTESSNAANQHLYGLALLHSGQAADALPWLERAAALKPDDAAFAEAVRKAREAGRQASSPPRPLDAKRFALGGFADRREEAPAPYPSNPLTRLLGHANSAKDFDWLKKSIPCQRECPAHTDIPGYLSANYRGDFDLAYRINLRDNVFPAVLGRVCSRPCESACRHGWSDGLGEPVAICFSKRSAADFKDKAPVVMEPWFPRTGKRVAVVGAGVAGLASARNLALMGHEVTVYEKHVRPGGMMNQGIPKFRLPWAHIEREIEQIRAVGVDIRCGVSIGRDLPLAQLLEDHDAVVLAAGTLRPNFLDLPGKELKGIRHGLEFLLEVNETDKGHVGEHVIVIGGGFTAMDCARTAKRLGAKLVELEPKESGPVSPGSVLLSKGDQVRVWYRRSVKEMLVTPGELEELQHEGIPMEFMVSPKAFVGSEGRVTAMRFVKTELGPPDASGRRRPVEIPGSEFEVPADTVLLATGQFPDTAWMDDALKAELVGADEWLKSGREHRTAHAKIFAAGDFATGAQSLIQAIGHAKETARKVDLFLMGYERLVDVASIEDAVNTGRIREMDYVPQQAMPALPLERRNLTAEVELGFDAERGVDEGQRCYFCHYKYEIDPDKCIYCDWCIKAKPRPECILKIKHLKHAPDGRIIGWEEAHSTEETQLIWINQEDCIRCNACVEACPVDAISVQKVSYEVLPRDRVRLQTPIADTDELVKYAQVKTKPLHRA